MSPNTRSIKDADVVDSCTVFLLCEIRFNGTPDIIVQRMPTDPSEDTLHLFVIQSDPNKCVSEAINIEVILVAEYNLEASN